MPDLPLCARARACVCVCVCVCVLGVGRGGLLCASFSSINYTSMATAVIVG